jgi:hypothetical protein
MGCDGVLNHDLNTSIRALEGDSAVCSQSLVQESDKTEDEESVVFIFSQLFVRVLLSMSVVLRAALPVANFCDFLV